MTGEEICQEFFLGICSDFHRVYIFSVIILQKIILHDIIPLYVTVSDDKLPYILKL